MSVEWSVFKHIPHCFFAIVFSFSSNNITFVSSKYRFKGEHCWFLLLLLVYPDTNILQLLNSLTLSPTYRSDPGFLLMSYRLDIHHLKHLSGAYPYVSYLHKNSYKASNHRFHARGNKLTTFWITPSRCVRLLFFLV